jgi:prophage regulatory protein
MSKQHRGLARLAPAVAAQLDELRSAIDGLGDEINATLVAQQQEAEREPEQPTTNEPTTIIEAASPTVCFRARQVAERLDVNVQTIWRWVREGRFPPGIRIGEARVIWTEAMIATWLAAKQANPDDKKRRCLPHQKRERLDHE